MLAGEIIPEVTIAVNLERSFDFIRQTGCWRKSFTPWSDPGDGKFVGVIADSIVDILGI
jgi:hypothetical protein